MARRRGIIFAIQWVVVGVYGALLILPAVLPLPSATAQLTGHFTLIAQFVFWGIWWPGVILGTMVVGRFWCGMLCPEGMLTELASRYGRGRAIPRWLRWQGWPPVAFALTTVYGQLVSVYEYPQPALLILGGSTLAAVAIGWRYGRGKRVWCRYLCPVSGVFGLLARVAPLHFRVDRKAWDEWQPVHISEVMITRPTPTDCPTLIDIRRMRTAAQCHACGRCAGHRDAVHLSWRAPSAEILAATPASVTTAEILLLCPGLLGLATGAFLWSMSPWFVAAKQAAAEWLVRHEWWWAFDTGAPWFVLTHYPTTNDAFSWLDGAMILAWLATTTLVLGGGTLLTSWLAARLSDNTPGRWRVQALTLVPLGGVSLFIGLSMLSVTMLCSAGFALAWIDSMRLLLLVAAGLWSLSLGIRQTWSGNTLIGRRCMATLFAAMAPALICAAWHAALTTW
jgi:polyferredoxin